VTRVTDIKHSSQVTAPLNLLAPEFGI
jgi:hypothetical protein